MPHPDATTYQRIDGGDTTRFVLPPRQLGPARWVGLLPILFGCLFAGFAVFWMSAASGALWNQQGQFTWTGLPFMVFGIPFVIVGLVPISVGLSLMVGRGEIIVRKGRLIVREKVGPFFWSRKRPTADIEHLEMVRDFKVKGKNNSSFTLPNVSAFRATGSAIKPMTVAWGFGRDMLAELANELAQLCEARGPAKLFGDEGGKISVVDAPPPLEEQRPSDQGDAATLPDPPANTKIILDVHDAGVTLTIPPAGFRDKGTKGMFSFALIWCAFMTFVTAMMIFSNDQSAKEMMVPSLIVAGLWAVGIGIFLSAINMARRQSILDVIGFPPDTVLLFTHRGLFGTKQREVAGADVAAIRADDSTMKVNNRPVPQLQVHRKQGKKLPLLTGRDLEELQWLAAVLRYAMDVPANA